MAPFVRGERYSIIAALTLDGYITQHIVPGSLDGEEFFDFTTQDLMSLIFYCFEITSKVILQLPKMNPYPQDCSVLIIDNCAIHKSAALCEIVEGVGRRLAFLPPYSPDLNPIEESFSLCK